MDLDIGTMGAAAALGLAAAGSALGTGSAAQGAVGATKKALLADKIPPAILTTFSAFPLSQTIYGIVLLFIIIRYQGVAAPGALFGAGLFGGLGMGFSAWYQGRVMAAACDAYVETDGKGTAGFILLAGIVESVAIFVMAMLIVAIGQA